MNKFPVSHIEGLVCQKDGSHLEVSSGEKDGYIDNGILACTQCSTKYPVREGILHILDKQEEMSELQKEEAKARDKFAQKYDERLAPRYYREVTSTVEALGDVANKKVIEYGCGTGRITEHIKGYPDELLLVDFSLNSLQVLQEKEGIGVAGLVHADASQLITKKDYFDKALSAQFLEHIPSHPKREQFVKNVASTVKDGGLFVCSAYHQDFRRKIRNQPKEGAHEGGMYYYYFNSHELAELFKKYFAKVVIFPIDIQLPLTERFSVPQKWRGHISRSLEKVPILNRFGHLLLVKGIKYNEEDE